MAVASPRRRLFWETMELARELQALLSFPFVLFILPLGMPLLTDNPRETGYDKQGLLCPQLSNTQIRLLRHERKNLLATARGAVVDPLLAGVRTVGSTVVETVKAPLSPLTKGGERQGFERNAGRPKEMV